MDHFSRRVTTGSSEYLQSFRLLLEDYWSKNSPQMYASLEAESFARHLETLGLRIPQLDKVLELEQAMINTLTDGRDRVVRFNFEPLPLLRALAEGRLPNEPGQEGDFEIELTAESLATGIDLDSESGSAV